MFLLDITTAQSLIIQKTQPKGCLYLINEKLLTSDLNNLDIDIQKCNRTLFTE